MNSKVKVTADKGGNVIVKSENNPEYGHIRVVQTRMETDLTTGFAKRKTIAALIPGLLTDLVGFGWVANQEVDGKIVVKEQLEPFNAKDPERDYKMAGKSGVHCCVDGQPIYRKHIFSMNESVEDVLIEHDNKEDIIAAYLELNEEKEEGVAPNEEFNV